MRKLPLALTTIALGGVLALAPALAASATVTTIPVGEGPVALASSPDRSTVYALDSNGSSISVIDAAAGAVSRTYATSRFPLDLAASPDGQVLYAAGFGGVDFINATTGARIGTVLTGSLVFGEALSRDGGTLYTLGNEGLDRIDTASMALRGTIPLTGPSGGFAAVAVSPDGRTAYVVNTASGTLSVVDTASGTETHVYTVGTPSRDGSLTEGLDVAPDGRTVYLADRDADTVEFIAASSGSVVRTVTLDGGAFPTGITTSADGSSVYVALTGTDRVGVLDAESGVVEKSVPVGSSPTAVLQGQQGALYVANADSNSVTVLSADELTNDVAPVLTAAAPPATATVGTPYSYTFTATGTPAPTFSVAPGTTLPAGLTLDATTGVLSGTPTAAGASTFQVVATNSAGSVTSDPVTITVAPAAVAPLSTPTITSPEQGQDVTNPVTFTGTGTPGDLIALVTYASGMPPQSSGPVEQEFAAANPIRVGADGTWTATRTLEPGDTTAFAVAFTRDASGTVTNTSGGSDDVDFTVVAAAAAPAPTPSTTTPVVSTGGPRAGALAFTGTDGVALRNAAGIAALLALAGIGTLLVNRRRVARSS